MINNYLDFVKGQRRTSLRLARRAMQNERVDCSELCKGIDAGLRIAYDIESRHWRTLQKDMEAVVKVVENMFPEEEAAYIGRRFY